ncbi:STAS domain-containing protein [Streptomyces tricolor]|uniref:STAS domain-containing protein n=1 Tax=Streptomyces tricolor TaxID=68277 RepID=UPI0038019530
MTGPPASPERAVPVLALGDVLPVTRQGELLDGVAERLRHDFARRLAAGPVPAGGVVTDLSGVETVDSFPGRVLAETAAGARPPAARTVVAGMRPAVAISLVELGLALPGPVTALDVDRALSLPGRTAAAVPPPPAHPEEGA